MEQRDIGTDGQRKIKTLTVARHIFPIAIQRDEYTSSQRDWNRPHLNLTERMHTSVCRLAVRITVHPFNF
jgi:hypothetical protein